MLKYAVIICSFLLLLGLGFLIYQTNSFNFSLNRKPLQKVTVRLAWLHQAQFAGFYVAKEKGLYEKAGLDVELKEYEENLKSLEELKEGQSDFTLVTPLEVITAVDQGDQIKAIAAIYQTSPLAFASLKSSHITSPADFKGKTIGAKGGNQEAKVKYRSLMQSYKLTSSDVRIKDVDYQMDEADDLLKKRVDLIDLYRTDQPYIMKEKGVDINLLLPERFGISGYGDTIVTTDSLISKNPEMVKAFVQATISGWEQALDDPEEALRIVEKYQNSDYADPDRQKHILEQSAPLIRPSGGQAIGDMSFIIWSQIADLAKSSKLVSDEFDVVKAYTSQFIK
ncbi:MAG: ABC transporter substrate-binding protein [Candidatus Levybacteria bacterium]|nr:ABC transporter substrate-binding protein [Candidatus Levybacteria bacterium]